MVFLYKIVEKAPSYFCLHLNCASLRFNGFINSSNAYLLLCCKIQVMDQNQQQWQYNTGELPADQQEPVATASDEAISWTASEFIEHDKSVSWYALLALVTVVVSAVLYLITKEVLSVIAIVAMALLFGVYGSAKPKTRSYTIDAQGLKVDDKQYLFANMKSFSVIEEGPIPYIQLLLRQRFSLAVTVYADPSQIDQIAEFIGQHVPYDQKKRDFTDALSSKIRF